MKMPPVPADVGRKDRDGPPDSEDLVVTGRLLRASGEAASGIEVALRIDGAVPTTVPPVTSDQNGRFRIALSEPPIGPLTIVISQPLAADLEVGVSPDADQEVVVVVPDPRLDPRVEVARVAKVLTAEREAIGSAGAVLAEALGDRQAKEARIRQAVDAILTDLTDSGGGDTRWKVRSGRTIRTLTEEAVQDGREVVSLAPPAVAASESGFEDGEVLSTRQLLRKLTGTPQPRDGYWRIDPLERLRLRQQHVGPDGLPAAGNGSGPPVSDGRGDSRRLGEETAEAIESSVGGRVAQLIDAMRLPEDPPLLTAEAAVTDTGPNVEFARGIADRTAFHFFHELIPALPDVWQEVFDRRFTSVVEAAVREVDAAGAPVDDLSLPESDGTASERPVDRLVSRLRRVATLYDTSSATRIRPPSASMVEPASAIDRGLTASSGMVVFRARDDIVVEPETEGGGGGGGGGGGDGAGTGTEIDIGQFPTEQAPKDNVPTLPSLLQELEGFLRGPHSFTVFAANGRERAINFGVLLTWRHEMAPLSYQVGEIAHTMTLAPGEKRKIVTKQRRSVKRSTAEVDKALRSVKRETKDTMRAESEIIRKATASTDFHLSSEGSTNLLVQGGTFTTNGTRRVGRDGNDTRRRFREAVVNAAEEVRNERSMEVKEEREDVFEEETTAEVMNPNDEVAMTAVFYTLQRRYRLKERLYRARPVIMVAMPFPDPAEITTAWMIRYAWILRRSLLDDRFAETLEYLTDSFLGDSRTLVHLERTLRKQESALAAAEHRLRSSRAVVEARSKALSSLRTRLGTSDKSKLDTVLELPGLNVVHDATRFVGTLLGGGGDDQAERERRALLLEAVEEDVARAEREAREAEAQLAGATNALQEATREFVEAKRRALNYEVKIAEARIHFSDNSTYYMQKIWANQPPDQRFLELHDVLVPVLDDSVRVTRDGAFDQPGLDGITPARFRVDFADDAGPVEFRSLAEVCHLGEPLGFQGNLAIFPMKDGNVLTDLILAPYLDEHEILRDPEDIAANWTLSELEEYADLLREKVRSGELSPEEFEHHAGFLRATLERLLTAPRLSEEEIVVPTTSLYVDLLTSGGSLLEPFKLEHRALDVEKVREELRAEKLESARMALRLAEGELADPDMDDFERHLVRSDGNGVLPPPSP